MTTAFIAAVALMSTPVQVDDSKNEPKWLTNYAEAQKISKKENKPLLVNFTGSDWCGWCIRLKNEVFSKDEFKAWAKKSVVLVELDFPRSIEQSDELKKQNIALRDKYEIRGYPTILFLDAEGNRLARSGYKEGGPEFWTKDADKLLAEAAKTSE